MITTKLYDTLNRLTNITSALPTNTVASAGYRYNTANQRERLLLADRSYWAYGYDALGQVQSGKKHWADDTLVPGQQFEYHHDAIGNRIQALAGGDNSGGNFRTNTYAPNGLNQYDNRTGTNAVDLIGNASVSGTLSIAADGQPITPVYRHNEYYQAVVAATNWTGVTVTATRGATNNTQSGHLLGPPVNQTFQYDADGNLTSDLVWNYTWDAENRLIAMDCQVAGPSAQHLTFEYDWQGRRIHKVVKDASQNTLTDLRFLYDGWNLLAVLTSDLRPLTSFLWGLDLSGTFQGAGGVGGLLAITDAASGTHFVCYDGNGNVTALLKATDASATARYEYGPFGELLRTTGPKAKSNPFRFSTKYTDDETDLLLYPRRTYSPSQGRFLSQDPLGEQGFETIRYPRNRLNGQRAFGLAEDACLYCFVRNNPPNGIDPYGLAYRCQSATVYIFLDRSQEAFNAGQMLAQLRAVVPEQSKVYWKAFPGTMPSGSQLGFQGRTWPGGSCNCLYFVQANVLPKTIIEGQGTLPILDNWGLGTAWVANAYADQVKWDFDDAKDRLPANWQTRSSSDGWMQLSGFVMAHEVVHALGGRHVGGQSNLMSRSASWNWLNLDVLPVDVSTSSNVRDRLLQWYPGNVTN